MLKKKKVAAIFIFKSLEEEPGNPLEKEHR